MALVRLTLIRRDDHRINLPFKATMLIKSEMSKLTLSKGIPSCIGTSVTNNFKGIQRTKLCMNLLEQNSFYTCFVKVDSKGICRMSR